MKRKIIKTKIRRSVKKTKPSKSKKVISLTDDAFWKSIRLTDDLQKNLRILHKKLGDKWTIKYKRHTMPVYFYKEKSEDKKITIYYLKYGSKRKTNEKLYPFYIQMYYKGKEQDSAKNVNDAYIRNFNNIQEGDYPNQKPINGSTVIEMALLLLKRFGVRSAYLNDGASVPCKENPEIDMDLTPFKLMEKNRTFYMKFGFQPVIEHYPIDFGGFKDFESFQKAVQDAIQRIKKIRMEEVHRELSKWIRLIDRIYQKDDFDKVEVHDGCPTKYTEYVITYKGSKEMLDKYHTHCIALQKILPKKGNLVKWMLKAFYKSCKSYDECLQVLRPRFSCIRYQKKIYKTKYEHDIGFLKSYNHDVMYRKDLR